MSLIKCPICKKEISNKAVKCPSCNATLKRKKSKAIILTMFFVIAIVFTIYETVVGIQHYKYKKSIQEYDNSVVETVTEFYDTLKTTEEKIKNNDYNSLKNLIKTLKKPIENFEKLPINEDSEYGLYIKSIRNNPMYITFKKEFIDSNSYDLDYGLTSWAYSYIIKTDIEEILKEKFPKTGN